MPRLHRQPAPLTSAVKSGPTALTSEIAHSSGLSTQSFGTCAREGKGKGKGKGCNKVSETAQGLLEARHTSTHLNDAARQQQHAVAPKVHVHRGDGAPSDDDKIVVAAPRPALLCPARRKPIRDSLAVLRRQSRGDGRPPPVSRVGPIVSSEVGPHRTATRFAEVEAHSIEEARLTVHGRCPAWSPCLALVCRHVLQ